MTKKKDAPVYSVVAIGDCHDDPKLKQERFTWIGRYIADVKPTHIVQIGDFATLDSLNTHIPNETFAGRLKGTFLEDVASANNALRLLEWEITGLQAEKHITLGNHERRLYAFEDKAPEISGMMQHELERVFSSNGWSFSEYGAHYLIDGVAFVHVPLNRLGKGFGGATSAVQIGNQSRGDLVYGHEHTARVHTSPKVGGEYVRVLNLGCSLPFGHVEDYARHNATGWSWGVFHLTIFSQHIQGYQFTDMKTLGKKYG